MADIGARDLMAVLARLQPGCRYRVTDIATSLGVDAGSLRSSLETLSVCGVAPYGPGDCLPLMVVGDFLLVTGELPGVRGPIRLSATEARALAAALQAAGFLADDGLTRRLLDAAATGSFDATELERTVRGAIEGHSPEVFEALAQATASSTVARMTYTRAGTTTATERDIEPLALYAERGAWYVTAWCRRADTWRTFRVDRVASAQVTGERFEPRDTASAPTLEGGAAERFEGFARATLRFGADANFSEREWPGAVVLRSDPDGALLVEVPYGGTAWIARRVVAGLGAVEAIGPAEVREAVATLAKDALAEASPA